jgi:hypothetical protein
VAAVGLDEAGDHVEHGGLAGAVGTEQTDRLAAAHMNTDIVDDSPSREALVEAVSCEAVGAAGRLILPDSLQSGPRRRRLGPRIRQLAGELRSRSQHLELGPQGCRLRPRGRAALKFIGSLRMSGIGPPSESISIGIGHGSSAKARLLRGGRRRRKEAQRLRTPASNPWNAWFTS